MKNQKYSIDEIEIGDEIVYADRYAEERESTWRVVNKLDKTLLVIIRIENDDVRKRIIDVSDVETIISK